MRARFAISTAQLAASRGRLAKLRGRFAKLRARLPKPRASLAALRARVAAALLTAVGCTQMAADIAGHDDLAALASATQASPAMKVFTAHGDYETFSPRFEIRYRGASGGDHMLALTPETYRGLEGPYNRRNAYGAALAYAPVLVESPGTRGLLGAVMRYGFCDPAPLVEELRLADIEPKPRVRVVIVPRQEVEPRRQLVFEVQCHE